MVDHSTWYDDCFNRLVICSDWKSYRDSNRPFTQIIKFDKIIYFILIVIVVESLATPLEGELIPNMRITIVKVMDANQ